MDLTAYLGFLSAVNKGFHGGKQGRRKDLGKLDFYARPADNPETFAAKHSSAYLNRPGRSIYYLTKAEALISRLFHGEGSRIIIREISIIYDEEGKYSMCHYSGSQDSELVNLGNASIKK